MAAIPTEARGLRKQPSLLHRHRPLHFLARLGPSLIAARRRPTDRPPAGNEECLPSTLRDEDIQPAGRSLLNDRFGETGSSFCGRSEGPLPALRVDTRGLIRWAAVAQLVYISATDWHLERVRL